MSREVAVAGLLGLLPIAYGLVRGAPVDVAARRAAVLLVVLVAVDRVVLPLARLIIGPPRAE